MVASSAVDDRIGLVFSWDPRARAWIKERGPEDAAPPPAAPRDVGAVQSFFLDPLTGRWHTTILGLRGRQVSADLGTAYRAPYVQGLDLEEAPVAKYGAVREMPKGGSKAPLLLVLIALLALVGGGAYAAQSMLGDAVRAATGSPAATTPSAPSAPVATAPAVVTATAAASTAAPATSTATAAPTSAPQTPAPTVRPTNPPRTAAPTPAKITTVTYTTTMSSGTRVTYTGPNAVIQNTALDMRFSVVGANGQVVYETLTVHLGSLGTDQTMAIKAGSGGSYFGSMRVTLPKGDQLLSVTVGNSGEIRALGTITVR